MTDEAAVAEYKVNPLLAEDNDGLTDIYVRALHPETGWGSYDVAALMAESFDLWLGAVDGRSDEVARKLLEKLLEAKARSKAAEAEMERIQEKTAELVQAVNELTGDDD